MDNDFIMNTINDSFKAVFNGYKGLYLYGSRAKGTSKEDSDYDIIILLERKMTPQEKSDVYGEMSRLMYELHIFMDTQFLTQEELEYDIFFYREVVNYGKFYKAERGNGDN